MSTAQSRRTAISAAATAWMATEPPDNEADLAFESAALSAGVIQPGEFIDEIWSDTPETVMVRTGDILVEIDVESGCTARGHADE